MRFGEAAAAARRSMRELCYTEVAKKRGREQENCEAR